MKKKRIIGTSLLVVLCMLFVWGCKSIKDSNGPETLGELAYDENKQYGYTVYLKENSEYVPYLVLTSDYNGQVLLLREELLDEKHVFHEESYGCVSYYKDSTIDRFLNEEYISLLEPKIQSAIIDSEIVITAQKSIGRAGEAIETIDRKVFLLSYAELGFTLFGAIIKEGESLEYFRNPENRVAYKREVPTCWWLRTPEVCWFNVACGINEEVGCGTSPVINKHGVRPAFCLSNALLIEQSRDVLEGQVVYVVKKSQ